MTPERPPETPANRGPTESSATQVNGMQPNPELLSIDIEAALRESTVLSVLEDIDRELVGLKPVKTRIREIAAFLLVEGLRKRAGLTSEPPTLHMSFTGGPGTGKTTVALRMATILQRLGYVRQGHVVVATRADLVGQYVGHTAPKTREVLKKAMGGILFIDEAYYLYRPENERDYGQEAIEMLLQVMENQREDLVVIFAGYKDRMRSFFRSNPGLRSRVAHHIDFPDYSLEELLLIGDMILQEQMYQWGEGARAAFEEYLRLRMNQPHFANARSVRNAIDRMKLRQANRLVSQGGSISTDDLTRFDVNDVRQSRVFHGGIDTDDAEEETERTK